MSKRDEEVNLLSEAIAEAKVAATKKKKPKVTIGFRVDEELKAEAEKTFGPNLTRILVAALRQAIKEARKK